MIKPSHVRHMDSTAGLLGDLTALPGRALDALHRLPARYMLDVNMESAADVVTHQRLLEEAWHPQRRPALVVVAVQIAEILPKLEQMMEAKRTSRFGHYTSTVSHAELCWSSFPSFLDAVVVVLLL